jgi:hypothetical protein
MTGGRRRERLTLDTSLLLEYWKEQQRRDVTETLLKLARTGEVELAVTARIRDDVPHDPLAAEIAKLGWIRDSRGRGSESSSATRIS